MPEISLPNYENEIDQLVEQARYLEALAHIRHLLSQYPHYAGAYYLLGKALLEADLHDLAADMFRRALSADPEMLIARIGLSIAHERRNDLGAAIWNLERAMELDLGNDDIAEELRRMYGRRDGEELDHVPQTRAGLARLYLRAHRYGRAVHELRSLLEAEPARPDLMTALAEAYWRDGQLVQASEVCQDILDVMPYNCKANLLLGTLWVSSGQEEGWAYLRRAQEVDPEGHRADAVFGTDSLLESHEVALDRLVYDPEALGVDRESAWFRRLESASVSVGISEAPSEMTESEVRLVDLTAGLESQIEIPDWLRELGGAVEEEAEEAGLGWMADLEFEEMAEPAGSDLSEEEALPSFDELKDLEATFEAETEIDLADLGLEEDATPEWLTELTSEELAAELAEVDGTPDWLLELVGEDISGAEEPETAAIEPETATEEGLVKEKFDDEDLDWLQGFDEEDAAAAETAAEELGEVAAQTPVEEAFDDEELDWLEEFGEQVAEEAVGEAGAIDLAESPDWLRELQASAPEEEAAPEDEAEEARTDWVPDAELLEDDGMPPWLEELKPEPELVDEEPESGLPSDEEVPDWLAELTSSETDAEPQDVPDWLARLEISGDTEPTPTEVAELPDVEAGVPIDETTVIEQETGEKREEAEDLVPEAPAEMQSDVTIEEAVEGAGEELEAPLTTDVAREAEAPVEEDGEAAEITPAEMSLSADALSGDEALAWLESLTSGKEETLRAEAEAASAQRVDEILGRRREVEVEVPTPEEADEVGEESAAVESELPEGGVVTSPPVVDEAPTVEVGRSVLPEDAVSDDVLSGDDALAWLESLAAGKEDILQAQVDAAAAERADEILGRRRTSSEARVTDAGPSTDSESETGVAEPADVPEFDETASPVPSETDAFEKLAAPDIATEAAEAADQDILSGDDALAWLESLAVGKEDELRTQAEVEAAQRVDELLGRPQEPEPELSDEPETASSTDEVATDSAVTDETTPGRWVAFEEKVVEVTEVPPVVAPGPVSETAQEEGETASADVVSDDEVSGEDALDWLERLPPDRETELRTQLEAEPVETTTADTEPRFFGWSAFDETPEEVPPAAAAAGEAEAAEASDTVAPDVKEAIPAALEGAPRAETKVEQETPNAADETAEPSVEATEEGEAPQEVAPEPAVEEESEAEISEVELDEMREHIKSKRSDHATRLKLAQTLWDVGEEEEALQHYSRLIKSNAKTEEVVADLERYAEEHADESRVLRTLGDAYMKFGELDKALAIYNRAMDLL